MIAQELENVGKKTKWSTHTLKLEYCACALQSRKVCVGHINLQERSGDML